MTFTAAPGKWLISMLTFNPNCWQHIDTYLIRIITTINPARFVWLNF